MKQTALTSTHKSQEGKMVEFAGYEMPVQYKEGMLKEHEWVRSGNVGLFDVSHMGQFFMEGENVAAFLSKITPTNFELSTQNLAKYTVLTNENGGIIDDLIISKFSDNKFFIVLNAACKEKDEAWIRKNLPENLKLKELSDRSLIAIQGAKSEQILQGFLKDANLADLGYMNTKTYHLKNGEEVFIGRTGYTGEDGFEVSIKNTSASNFWIELCRDEFVKPIGLGARDSLRLEMGYPLYGHDLDETTSPVEAVISWVISKSNTNFIGSERIINEKSTGIISRKRFGIKLLDRGIAREGCEVKTNGKKIGKLTSGGYSPTLKVSIGQGYFDPNIVKINDEVEVIIRDRAIKAIITSPCFIEAKTKAIKK